MRMLVFYRSREYTNAIISSTRDALNRKKLGGLDVEFINLDKRNYEKVLKGLDYLPDYIFIWYDEEKVSDYINEKYPFIKVIHFDKNSSVEYHKGFCYDTKSYKLIDIMIDTFKSNLKKQDVYTVDVYKLTTTKENLDDLNISNKMSSGRYVVFGSLEESKAYIKTSLERQLETNKRKYEKM